MTTATKISFCVTACNRLWQLKQTLSKNLQSLPSGHEITLIDFGSQDGIVEWVWRNFEQEIASKTLNFFEVRNPVRWSCPKAKNLAHRLSNGAYLFNLDADNFITREDVELIISASGRRQVCHQWSGNWLDGSFGRIGIPSDIFLSLGGYDETLLPMGSQDVDLLHRAASIGPQPTRLAPPSISAIQNSMADKLSEYESVSSDPVAAYRSMNKFNENKCRFRFNLEGAQILNGFSTYYGLLNGESVIIDGLNMVRPHQRTDSD